MSDAPRYRNRPMPRDEAVNLVADAGLLIADVGEDGRRIPGTARLDLAACGDGFDVTLPVEHLVRLYATGLRTGRESICR